MNRLGLALSAVLLAASAARADPPTTSRQAEGAALFARTCVYCHGEHAWAARDLGKDKGPDRALIAQRTDLDPAYIRHVLRHGVGNMPAYTPTDLSPAQVEAVVDYLTRNKPAAHPDH
jgi:mono/diheme cytochrome c family protein